MNHKKVLKHLLQDLHFLENLIHRRQKVNKKNQNSLLWVKTLKNKNPIILKKLRLKNLQKK